jgi:hypothetical protein
MVFCNNINGLCKELKQEQEHWRLFIDSYQRSLKSGFLHNGNAKPSIPIARSVLLKETYSNMKVLLEAIQYNVHQSNICEGLRVNGMLMGMQGGFADAFGIVTLEPNFISSVTGKQGRRTNPDKTVSSAFLSLIP